MATKKNLLTIILVVLIAINIAALATLFFWHHHGDATEDRSERHKRMGDDFLKKELNLSDEQTKQMDQLKLAHRDTLALMAGKMREKRNFLTLEMMKTTPNDSLMNATCDEIGVIYATIRKLNIVHYREMKNLCNDEQKKKLDTVFKGIFSCDETMLCRFEKMKSQGGCGDAGKGDGKQEGCGRKEDKKHEGCGMTEEEKHDGCPEK
jgi:hypothetical protein